MTLKRMIVIGALALVLAAGPAVAQTPPPPTNPPQTPPAGQQPPTPPPALTQPPPAPRPFPEGAKIAYVDLQRIAQNSAEGKAAATKIQALQKQKLGEIQEKNKQVEDLKKKLEQGGTVLSDQARTQIEKDIDRTARELQFMQQNAQADAEALERELNTEFQRKLNPVVDQIAKEKGLHMVFSVRDSPVVWVETGLDLSEEVIKRLDTAAKAAPVKKD
jgi:outer membrane protein